jgi:hypothetical protein
VALRIDTTGAIDKASDEGDDFIFVETKMKNHESKKALRKYFVE